MLVAATGLILALAACSSPKAAAYTVGAGCGNGGHIATGGVCVSPSPSTASAMQYASGMNGPIKAFQTAWSKWNNDCPGDTTSFSCKLEIGTVGITAKTIDVEVQVLSSPSSNGYIGPPPAELASLLSRTDSLAVQVGDEIPMLGAPTGSWLQDAITLDSACDEWGPYLSA